MNGNNDNTRTKEINLKFANRIRELREERKATDPSFSQRQFAKALGVSSTYLNYVEMGQTVASATLIMKIAEKLGVDADELFALANKMSPDLQPILNRPGVPALLRKVANLSEEEIASFNRQLDEKQGK